MLTSAEITRHDHYCLFAPRINKCYSSSTSRSRWSAYSTQSQPRGCNINITFWNKGGEPICYHGLHKFWIIVGLLAGGIYHMILSWNSTFILLWRIEASYDMLIMKIRFDAILYSKLGNKISDVGHVKCSCGLQAPHRCFEGVAYISSIAFTETNAFHLTSMNVQQRIHRFLLLLSLTIFRKFLPK